MDVQAEKSGFSGIDVYNKQSPVYQKCLRLVFRLWFQCTLTLKLSNSCRRYHVAFYHSITAKRCACRLLENALCCNVEIHRSDIYSHYNTMALHFVEQHEAHSMCAKLLLACKYFRFYVNNFANITHVKLQTTHTGTDTLAYSITSPSFSLSLFLSFVLSIISLLIINRYHFFIYMDNALLFLPCCLSHWRLSNIGETYDNSEAISNGRSFTFNHNIMSPFFSAYINTLSHMIKALNK